MRAFGRTAYEQVAYINFERSSSLKSLFTTDFDLRGMITAIQIETGVTVNPRNTLIILDEIQEAPGAVAALQYFQENAPEYDVISAGTLLGAASSQDTSFPVGKIEFLDLHPLSFTEFLLALNEKPLVDLLASKDWPLITNFKARYIERLKQYYYIGGMPEAVFSFSQRTDFDEVRAIQKRILIGYEQDFARHAPSNMIPRIGKIWNAVPAQLAKENRKFIYGLIRKGSRASEYGLTISWLIDCGLIHKVNNVANPAMPIETSEDFGAFKLFMMDIGLMSAMLDLDIKSLLAGNDLFEAFKGALTQQYVLQQLLASASGVYYWSPENARAEIDFLLQIGGKIIPVEAKAAENLRAKSLRTYCQKYQPEMAIRTSLSDYRRQEWMTNLPLYAISTL
jgi:predicted AAA+ superfamily ATPase